MKKELEVLADSKAKLPFLQRLCLYCHDEAALAFPALFLAIPSLQSIVLQWPRKSTDEFLRNGGYGEVRSDPEEWKDVCWTED